MVNNLLITFLPATKQYWGDLWVVFLQVKWSLNNKRLSNTALEKQLLAMRTSERTEVLTNVMFFPSVLYPSYIIW